MPTKVLRRTLFPLLSRHSRCNQSPWYLSSWRQPATGVSYSKIALTKLKRGLFLSQLMPMHWRTSLYGPNRQKKTAILRSPKGICIKISTSNVVNSCTPFHLLPKSATNWHRHCIWATTSNFCQAWEAALPMKKSTTTMGSTFKDQVCFQDPRCLANEISISSTIPSQ